MRSAGARWAASAVTISTASRDGVAGSVQQHLDELPAGYDGAGHLGLLSSRGGREQVAQPGRSVRGQPVRWV